MSSIGIGLAIDDAKATAYDLSGAFVTVFTLETVTPVVPNDKDNSTVSNVLLLTGLGSMIGSIPLFKAAKRNYRKGMNLSFSNQKIPSFQKNRISYQSIPSLKLKINL